MLAIHPQARTTPAVRAEIARSSERSGVLAKRYGVSTETIRKWRKRGPADCQDRSARPHKLPWKASDEERAIVCALRRSTGFPLDDLTFVVSHFLPHLNRDAVYRILKAEGLNPSPPSEQAGKPRGTFKDYEVSFIHLDVKHLPKLQDRDRVLRKRSLHVAIERASRYVHLAVTDDDTAASAAALLTDGPGAFPFRVTQVLTDRGSCFAADAFEAACERHDLQHRKTRPYTPIKRALHIVAKAKDVSQPDTIHHRSGRSESVVQFDHTARGSPASTSPASKKKLHHSRTLPNNDMIPDSLSGRARSARPRWSLTITQSARTRSSAEWMRRSAASAAERCCDRLVRRRSPA